MSEAQSEQPEQPDDPSGDYADHPDHHAATVSRNAKYGLILFGVYVIFYVGFIYLSAFRPDAIQEAPFGGVNVAILYGMGLILAAFLLALVYMTLCRAPAGDKAHPGDR